MNSVVYSLILHLVTFRFIATFSAVYSITLKVLRIHVLRDLST